jgi:hypothetical protein
MTTRAALDRPIRFHNRATGEILLVFSVDSPESCPRCQRLCCIFLERRPRPLCLACATDADELAHAGVLPRSAEGVNAHAIADCRKSEAAI